MQTQNIQQKYQAEFEQFLKEKLEAVKREQLELETLLNGGIPKPYTAEKTPPALDEVSTPLLNEGTTDFVPLSGYRKLWTWRKKIDFFLSSADMTTTEIVDAIILAEPNLEKDRSQIVGTVSAVLSARSKKPTDAYSKIKNDRNVNVFSLNKKA